MKNILYQVIESQTHVGMPRGAKLSFAHNERKYFAIHLNSNTTTSKHRSQVKRTIHIVCKQSTPEQTIHRVKLTTSFN
jgi:hypothetical protein